MAEIATCPQCAKQLELPASIGLLDRVACPECDASFLLSEAVRSSLPVAKLVPAEEAELAEQVSAEQTLAAKSLAGPLTEPLADSLAGEQVPIEVDADVDVNVDSKQAVADVAPPQQSWEERLKKALALDSSSEIETPEMISEADLPAQEPTQTASPTFEFKLDPDLAAQASTIEDQTEAAEPIKTLADFAAAAIEPAETLSEASRQAGAGNSDSSRPTAESFSFPKLNLETPELPSAGLPKFSNSQEQSISNDENAIQDEADVQDEADIRAFSNRRPTQTGFPKLAAFAAGPVVGTVLGLYGLLWVQGRQADYVGMRHVLPASMLPASFSPHTCSEKVASNDKSIHDLLVKKTDQPLPTLKRDNALSLATATQPLQMPRISASDFEALVKQAGQSLPALLSSDMSTSAATQRTGQAYMTLCHLAEQFDFANQLGLAPHLEAKANEAKRIMRDAITSPSGKQGLAHVAGRWWEYAERPSAGILFGGQVVQVDALSTGSVCWVQLETMTPQAKIPVWVEAGSYRVGDTLGVVGTGKFFSERPTKRRFAAGL